MSKIFSSCRQRMIVAATLVIMVINGVFAGTAAWATSTTLCAGYGACVSAGLSDGDYGAASGASYWGMDAGHNCTNYAAYRLIRNGVDASYLRGHGNAYEWGSQAQAHGVTVNSTPTVGAIAWWPANSGGAGPAGHVAYVEQVGAGYIVVSEDNYGGNFYWKRMSPGGYYPPAFIHFGDITSSPTSVAPRLGVLTNDGHMLAKEGDLRAGWVDEAAGITAGVLSGNRVGVLNSAGVFSVKEGDLWSGWVDEFSGVTAGYLSGNRIGVLTNDGHFLVKEGDLWSGWVDEFSGVTAGYLSGNRIGVLTNDGHFLVKEGDLRAGWVDEAAGITAGVLSGNRVGVLNSAGVFSVKEGDLWSGWVDEFSGVTAGNLSGNRIGVLTNDGHFLVKEGDLRAGWVDEAAGITAGVLSGNRVGVLNSAGVFSVKEGDLWSGWVDEFSQVRFGYLSNS